MSSNEKIIKDLQTLVCSYQVFYHKLRAYHWNLVGKNFFTLHVVFEDMYKDAQLKIDVIAERLRYLGGRAVSGLHRYLEGSFLDDVKEIPEDVEMMKNLRSDMRKLIDFERKILKELEDDFGTDDMLAGFARELEKQEWMISSWLEKSPVVK